MATVTGGNELSKKLTEMAGMLSTGAVVRVGFLEGATYPSTPGKHLSQKQIGKVLQGKAVKAQGGSGGGGKPVAMIAAIQEFGAPSRGIPPRPFFRNMIAKRKSEWAKGIAAQLKATGYNADLTLRRTGEVVAGQLRQSIIETNSPSLAASTIARKGFSKPLIDTSHMINSIDYEVKA